MPAFGMKSVRAAEEAWVQESSAIRSEAPTSEEEAAAPRRATQPSPSSSAVSAPKAANGFVPTGRFARRAPPSAQPVRPSTATPTAAPTPAPAVAAVYSAPPASNQSVSAPSIAPVVAQASAAARLGAHSTPAPSSSVAPKAAAPSPGRPNFAAARAAALHGVGSDADDQGDDLGVMDENGELRPILDAQVSDPEDEAVSEAARPRSFARVQLTARRMVQELGDVRRLPLTELLALEQRAMRTPLEVIEEFRSAYQVEVRSRHATGVHSLKDALAQHPGETVFLLQYGENRAIRHVPKTGGANDLLHGLVLSSIPMSASPFDDLQSLLATSLSPAASAGTVPEPGTAAIPSQATPQETVAPSAPARAEAESAPGQGIASPPPADQAQGPLPVTAGAAPEPSVPPARRTASSASSPAPEAAAQRWSRRPRT